ncbi:MAG TPA: DUF1499 domain-containing protein [Candidatus Binatia bacterium]|jgi:uncharacterized protein (DUF1499 family)|nr:DUF1499 domain-containing protein [Candidatus Binatia bacterium]
MGRLSGRTPPSRTLDVVGLLALVVMGLGPLLAWLRLVPGLVGFILFALGGLVALIVGVMAVVQAARGRGTGRMRFVAGLVGVGFLALGVQSRGAPAINDFTTDPDDPPAFHQAASEAANAGRDMAYPAPFAAVQRSCCADLAPIRLAVPPATAFIRVESVALAQPDWIVTRRDPAGGEIEAVATTRVFGFHDDIVIRVRPEQGGGSRVDIRSKSRDGRGDMGTNADRIRRVTAALTAAQEPPAS